MMFIKCNDRRWPPDVCNKRTEEVEEWMQEHVGYRWKDWDWSQQFGYILMPENETTVAFILRFGLHD